MIKIALLILSLSIQALADERDADVQHQIKTEYGSCYTQFAQNLDTCKAFSCTYPDLSDSKAWKAQRISGIQNGFCYVVYYSYVGADIIGSPDHCFYSTEDYKALSALYRILFSTNSPVDSIETKSKIISLNARVCKKNAVQNNNS